jgi:hypothetical protein
MMLLSMLKDKIPLRFLTSLLEYLSATHLITESKVWKGRKNKTN